VPGRSQCRQCTAVVPAGAKYCLECGASVTLLVVDLLGVDESPLPTGTDVTPHPRRGLWAVLALVAGMVLVLWGLTRGVDRPNDEPLGAEVPEEGIGAVDPATSTTAVATTASPTTGAPTTTSEEGFVNDAAGPVLGEDVGGVLVIISRLIMYKIVLSTGTVERIDLEHPVYPGPESDTVVNGNLVSLSISGNTLIITDLFNGSQLERPLFLHSVDLVDAHVAGRASVDSVWLATSREPGQASAAIEVDLDGEVRRRVEIRKPFSIRWAKGDELILESPDGSFRYDAATGVAVRMPGAVLAFEPGFVITSSCDESLRCDVRLDQGSGPEVVDWLSASDVFDGSIELSPDLSGALLHVYGSQGGAVEFTFIDLHTGSRVDLGEPGIEPYLGVVWVEGSRWIIGQDESPNRTVAIDTETGTQVDLAFPRPIISRSFLAFIPPN